MLRWQDLRTQRRRRLERPLALAVLHRRFPLGGAWVSVALALRLPLLCERLLHADALCPGGGVGQAPRLPRAVGEGARSEPAPGVVGVPACGPSRQSSPDEAVQSRNRGATDDVAVRGRPPSSHGVEGIAAGCRRGPRSVLTEGLDLGVAGVEAGLAERPLQRGPCAVAPCRRTPGLSSAVKALGERRSDRRRRRQASPALGYKGGAPWQEGVCEDLSRIGCDHAGVRPAPRVAVVDPAGPAAPVHNGFQAIAHPRADHRGAQTSLRPPGRGRPEGATVANAASEPWGQPSCVQRHVLCEPCQGHVVAKACAVSCQAPGGRGVLP
jgi:hypothetical protein